MTTDEKDLADKLARQMKKETGRDVKVRVVREDPDTEERRSEVASRVATILDRVKDLREPFLKRKEERRKRRQATMQGFFEGLRRSREDAEKPGEETKKDEEEHDSDLPPGMRRTRKGHTIAPEFG